MESLGANEVLRKCRPSESVPAGMVQCAEAVPVPPSNDMPWLEQGAKDEPSMENDPVPPIVVTFDGLAGGVVGATVAVITRAALSADCADGVVTVVVVGAVSTSYSADGTVELLLVLNPSPG